VIPTITKTTADRIGNSHSRAGCAVISRAAKKTGTPIGIESVVAWTAVPVTTPRRTAALVHANVTAAISANTPPSTASSRHPHTR
jgi:hypothetical protein